MVYVVWRCYKWGKELFADTRGPTPEIRRRVAFYRIGLCVIPFALLTTVSLMFRVLRTTGGEGDDGGFMLGVGITIGAVVLVVVGPAFAWGVHAGYTAEVARAVRKE
jgi:hypothetical protein